MGDNSLVQFGKFGTVGVVLASLSTVIIFGSIIYKMSSNFSETVITITENHAEATKENTRLINQAINKNTEVLSSIKTLSELKK